MLRRLWVPGPIMKRNMRTSVINCVTLKIWVKDENCASNVDPWCWSAGRERELFSSFPGWARMLGLVVSMALLVMVFIQIPISAEVL